MSVGNQVTGWQQWVLQPQKIRFRKALFQIHLWSGIALGLYTAADVDALHAGFQSLLSQHGAHIDAFFYCPHLVGRCNCRKPLPGLFEQAVEAFPDVTAATSLMIGDSLVDMEFGRRLGITTILIDGETEQPRATAKIARETADLRFPSLAEAADALLDER